MQGHIPLYVLFLAKLTGHCHLVGVPMPSWAHKRAVFAWSRHDAAKRHSDPRELNKKGFKLPLAHFHHAAPSACTTQWVFGDIILPQVFRLLRCTLWFAVVCWRCFYDEVVILAS